MVLLVCRLMMVMVMVMVMMGRGVEVMRRRRRCELGGAVHLLLLRVVMGVSLMAFCGLLLSLLEGSSEAFKIWGWLNLNGQRGWSNPRAAVS